MLDHTTALQKSPLILFTLEDMHVRPLYHVREIGLQFHQFARTIYYIYATIVVEEQRTVMEVTHTRNDRPRTLSLFGREDISVAHRALLVGS